MTHVRVDNLRRSIRNDRMKQVYDQAIAAGWTAALRGSGHIRMHAPNDSKTFLTISVTASGARSALNVEAVLKRWQREQEVQIVSNEKIEAAIDRQELGISVIGREPDATAAVEGESTTVNESDEAIMEGQIDEPMASHPNERALANQARLRAPSVACPDCGLMFRPGGLNSHRAKMHFKYSQKQNGSEPKVAPQDTGSEPMFSISQIVTVANYGGSGGLIEVTKLEEGLRMLAQMRGS